VTDRGLFYRPIHSVKTALWKVEDISLLTPDILLTWRTRSTTRFVRTTNLTGSNGADSWDISSGARRTIRCK
jgi:hypothetical protein